MLILHKLTFIITYVNVNKLHKLTLLLHKLTLILHKSTLLLHKLTFFYIL